MYFNGVCRMCGKMIYGKEEYKQPDNCVCEIIVCMDCNKKAMDLIERSMRNGDDRRRKIHP